MGMHIHALHIGKLKDAQQIDGVAAERARLRIQSPVLDEKIFLASPRFQKAGQQAGQRRFLLLVLKFQCGTEDARQVADILGYEKIPFHEAFDGMLPVFITKTEARRQFGLDGEGDAFFGTANQIMQIHADVPQKGFRLLEHAEFGTCEHAVADQIGRIIGVIKVFPDPVEGLQVAQAAFAILHIGFDQIAAFALPPVTFIAFGKFGRGKFRPGIGGDFGPEGFAQFLVKSGIAPEIACFQKGGADGDVLFRQADAFGKRTRCLADFQAQVPQHIEDELDHAFAPGRALERAQEQKIDIRTGRQHGAAIATGCNDAKPLCRGGILRVVEMLGGEIVEDLDQRILHEGECMCPIHPRQGATFHRILHPGACGGEYSFDVLQRVGAKLHAVARGLGHGRQVVAKAFAVQQWHLMRSRGIQSLSSSPVRPA